MRQTMRFRRLRRLEPFRRLMRETRLSVDQLIAPLFVRPGKGIRAPIPSMPGQCQLSVDQLVRECQELAELRVPAVLLFGMVRQGKDERASQADAKDGVVQQAVRAVKAAVPGLAVITDVCLCAYTNHGHCGIIKQPTGKKKTKRSPVTRHPSPFGVDIDNDATVELLAKTAVSHAQAGADMVAPSDMMDGRVAAIRQALDLSGYEELPIMSYAVKYASALYGPFRQAVESAPAFGDRASYQMDPANVEEAVREARLDVEEGADLLIVKPALAYLDVIARVKQATGAPVAAFNVSGEYAMVKAASARGWLAERPTWLELLLAMRRAGADMLITYWAKDAAKFLQER